MAGPMQGIRVVELGVWVAGPAAGGILADWGADVVKIEPPGGDPCRLFRDIYGADMPTNPIFEMDNRSKRSITLDLSTEGGRAVAAELVAGADVFITNVRIPALRRAGLDPETLTARHPRLVYGHISGFGLEGAEADAPAFDVLAFWARAGIAHMLTAPGGAIPFQRGGMGDHSTGMQLAGAISAALFHRERTGEGQLVSTSLLRQGVYTISFDLNMVLGWGRHPAIGTRASTVPTAAPYVAGDGRRFFVLGIEPERHFAPMARCIGRPDLIDDPRYRTQMDRAMNGQELIAIFDAAFATKSLDEWAAIFATEPDMFWTPINSAEEVVNDPQVVAAGALVEVPDGLGTTTMIASPSDFHGTPWEPRFIAPHNGQHTLEVLRELGHSEADIEALIAAGAARLPAPTTED